MGVLVSAEQTASKQVALLNKALSQMECLQENLRKGMSKSIQRMQSAALMETVAEIRAALDGDPSLTTAEEESLRERSDLMHRPAEY